MVSYRCIGYGITGNDGVATLNKNLDGTSMSHSYTGSGVGELDFVASAEPPSAMNSGSEQSEPYTVYDTIFKDMGTSTDYGSWSDWGSQQEYKPKITRDTYCKIEVDTGKSGARMYKQIDTSNNNVCIEFDVKQVTSSNSNVWATLRNNATNVLGNLDMNRFSSYGGVINEWVHFKLIISPTNCLVYINNNSSPYTYISSGVTRFYFQIDTNTTELDYKNFIIYPV